MAKAPAATSSANILTMTPSQAEMAIEECFNSDISVFLWGPPGIGKSSIIRQIGNKLGMNVVDIRLSQMEPTDLRGIPYPTNEADPESLLDAVVSASVGAIKRVHEQINPGDNPDQFESIIRVAADSAAKAAAQRVGSPGMRWAAPTLFPRDPDARTIILLDELNAAPPSIQAAAYQLILDRRLGEYELPPGCKIIGAGNRDTDRGATFKMPKPLENRLLHIEMKHDFEEWSHWAIGSGVNPSVLGYLNFRKDHLMDFDPTSSSRGFATPRSWEFVSKIMNNNPKLPTFVLSGMVAGAVGQGVATEYMAHRRRAAELPDPSKILSGEVTKLDNKDNSLCYTLSLGMCYELRSEYDRIKEAGQKEKDMEVLYTKLDNFIGFILDNFQAEIIVMAARVALKQYKLPLKPAKIKNFARLSATYGELIMKA